jgi:hypothetical protein
MFTYLPGEPFPIEAKEAQDMDDTMSVSPFFQDNQGIQDIKPWRSFNLQSIKARYHQVLSGAQT